MCSHSCKDTPVRLVNSPHGNILVCPLTESTSAASIGGTSLTQLSNPTPPSSLFTLSLRFQWLHTFREESKTSKQLLSDNNSLIGEDITVTTPFLPPYLFNFFCIQNSAFLLKNSTLRTLYNRNIKIGPCAAAVAVDQLIYIIRYSTHCIQVYIT